MNHPFDIVVIEVGMPGPPGTGFTPAEAAQMRADMDTFLGTTIAEEIGDLNDVDASGADDGYVLVYDESEDEWVASPMPAGSITVYEAIFPPAFQDVMGIWPASGLSLNISSSIAGLSVAWAGTGSAGTAARSDHTHSPTILSGPRTFAATGALSSGSRTLLTYNAGPLLDGVTYDCYARVVLTVRNDINAGVVDLGLRIGSSASFPKTTHQVRNVGGVDSQHEWTFARAGAGSITGSGGTVAVVADVTFSSGDPTNVRHGYVEFFAWPRR